jgi:protein-arginine kinase activator protein McsA
MVQLTPHPLICETCRTQTARVSHRMVIDGVPSDRWLCYQCARALMQAMAKKEEGGIPHE